METKWRDVRTLRDVRKWETDEVKIGHRLNRYRKMIKVFSTDFFSKINSFGSNLSAVKN